MNSATPEDSSVSIRPAHAEERETLDDIARAAKRSWGYAAARIEAWHA